MGRSVVSGARVRMDDAAQTDFTAEFSTAARSALAVYCNLLDMLRFPPKKHATPMVAVVD